MKIEFMLIERFQVDVDVGREEQHKNISEIFNGEFNQWIDNCEYID